MCRQEKRPAMLMMPMKVRSSCRYSLYKRKNLITKCLAFKGFAPKLQIKPLLSCWASPSQVKSKYKSTDCLQTETLASLTSIIAADPELSANPSACRKGQIAAASLLYPVVLNPQSIKHGFLQVLPADTICLPLHLSHSCIIRNRQASSLGM